MIVNRYPVGATPVFDRLVAEWGWHPRGVVHTGRMLRAAADHTEGVR